MQPAIFKEHEISSKYGEVADAAIVQQTVWQFPWGNNLVLLDRLNTPEEMLK